MDEKLKQVEQKLTEYGQEQLLNEYNRITDEKQKQDFLDSLLTIDYNQVNKLYEKSKEKPIVQKNKIEPIEYVDKARLSKEKYEELSKLGTQKIKDGKLAVVTMAGGQGTRLGHKGPKGTFDLGLDSHKSIFEILTDTLKEARSNYNVDIPWYIMTSDENDEETQKFFEKNNYFGYPKKCVTFFKQGKLPMVSLEGKILIDENHKIKEASDGHGGIFHSMYKEGIVYDMKARGIEWVFIGGVDNVLVKPVDPILIGLAIKQKAVAAGKSLVKANAHEKVGVFCRKNGKPSVIEYTEISNEMAEEKDELGNLKYGESHILCNLFSMKAIDKISQITLPYHIACKKAKYIDENGKLICTDVPNAYKFEAFLFDAFESLDNLSVLRVKREEEFAPVKNASGDDSPETARKLYINYHKSHK